MQEINYCTICPICGSVIEPTYWKDRKRVSFKKFCSSKCRGRDGYKRRYSYYRNYWLTRPNLWAWKKPRICEVCGKEYEPKSPKAKTCCRKCSIKRWKILNPEKSKEYNRQSARRCRKRDPERYRFYSKNRRHMIREASNGVSGKKFSTVFTLKDWDEIKEKHNQCCVICGASDLKLTIDHIIPLSKGGKHNRDNIQPLCHSCNSRKKDKI